MYDLIILGGGPAGLTATVYALRKRLNVLLITRDLGGKTNFRLQLPFVEKHLVITGEEVVNRFANEVEYLEFARDLDKAEKVEKIDGGFRVSTRGGSDLRDPHAAGGDGRPRPAAGCAGREGVHDARPVLQRRVLRAAVHRARRPASSATARWRCARRPSCPASPAR